MSGMKPEDVPDDLVRAALAAYCTTCLQTVGRTPYSDHEEEARRVLAAALPLHEQQVRASVTNELEQEAAHERQREIGAAERARAALASSSRRTRFGRVFVEHLLAEYDAATERAVKAEAEAAGQRQRADQLDETLGWQYDARNTGERVHNELRAENERLRAELAELGKQVGELGRVEYEIGIRQPGDDDAMQYSGFSEADVKARAAEQSAIYVERVCRRGEWKAADDAS